MLNPVNLRIEYRRNPMGMDELSPRFSYRLEGDSNTQTAYRILVNEADGEVVWDSGFVALGVSLQIVYEGSRFKPFTRYSWNVQVKDETGATGPWSEERAFFETGYLGTSWKGDWIRARTSMDNQRAPQRVVKDFEIPGTIAKARLCITALGLYDAYLNGKPVTDRCFTPGWTQYYDRVQYQVYDVTNLLNKGGNAIAVSLGDGWFSGRICRYWSGAPFTYGEQAMLRADLRITLESGEELIVPTDRTWTAYGVDGAIRMSDIYMGETYDAMTDNLTWKLPHFGKPRPLSSMVHVGSHKAKIVWQSGADVRRMFEVRPVKITKRGFHTYLVDFGQNLTGRERIKPDNSCAGNTIVIRHGEMLNPDGSLYRENLRTALATTQYTCGVHAPEWYEPTFTFFGFRYLEISGWPGELTEDQISAQVIYSELEKVGSFHCSNPLLNQLYSNVVWGQRSNFLDVPTDCPQRDERLGWTGDTQVFANTASYNMFSAEFYEKWITDLNHSLDSQGCYPSYAPDPYRFDSGATGWSDAGIICPAVMMFKYGDIRQFVKYLPNIRRWLQWQIENAGGSLIVKNARYGDWLNLDANTPEDFLSTAYLAGMCALVSSLSRLAGIQEDVEYYARLSKEVATAFGKQFFSPDGEIQVKAQTAALLALEFDLCPDEKAYRKTVDFLVNDIRMARKLHLSTGFLGTPLLMKVLTKIGEVDLAYDLLQQTTYPGWLYPVTQGATTMWERWNSWSDEAGFGEVSMNSFNHYAYGAVAEWFFEVICGIMPDTDSVENLAFKRFLLAPKIGNSLQYASAEFCSEYGMIKSAWKRQDGMLTWSFEVPPNSSAELHFPTTKVVPGLDTAKGIVTDETGKITALPGRYKFNFPV